MKLRASEADVQKSILEWLRFNHWLTGRFNAGAVTGEYTDQHGTTRSRFVKFSDYGDPTITQPDILAFRDGRALALEVKRPGWKPPKPGTRDYERYQRQRRFLERWQEAGGEAAFVTSLEDVIAMVERRRKVA